MTLRRTVIRCSIQAHELTTSAPRLRFFFLHPLLSPSSSSSVRPFSASALMADYRNWTRESLVRRMKKLEDELKQAKGLELSPSDDASPPPATETKPERSEPMNRKARRAKKHASFDASRYASRFIALKFAYLGKNFNGFEHQISVRVPTIEEELWKALVKSCLIAPVNGPEMVDLNMPGLEYSKCGRTDKGVSAFGQVIGLRVRSNRPVPREPKPEAETTDPPKDEAVEQELKPEGSKKKKQKVQKVPKEKPEWDPVADELNYPRILNRLLPPEIRVLAWCPNPPEGFDARFSCRERQYRYFFTQPAFSPMPAAVAGARQTGGVKEGWLDIDAMREAARLFEGTHDFRNFCKVEAGKQITNFVRAIFESDIVEVEDAGSVLPYLNGATIRPESVPAGEKLPKVFYFHVRGSAFLWHQIRHMVAVLFLVGQGLEKPSIVSELLDVEKHPRRPNYHLADEVPLVLWDCIFPGPEYSLENLAPDMKDALDWIWVGEDNPSNMYGTVGLANEMWRHWREKKMDELLANRLFDMISRQADLSRRTERSAHVPKAHSEVQKVFLGGNEGANMGRYTPVLEKVTLPAPEELNDLYAQKYGFKDAEAMRETKNWRSAIKLVKKAAAAGEDVVMSEAEPGATDA